MDFVVDNYADYYDIPGPLVDLIFQYVGDDPYSIIPLNEPPETLFIYWTYSGGYDKFLSMYIKYKDCFGSSSYLYYKLPKIQILGDYVHENKYYHLWYMIFRQVLMNEHIYLKINNIITRFQQLFNDSIMTQNKTFNIFDQVNDRRKYLDHEKYKKIMYSLGNYLKDNQHNYMVII